MTKIRFQDLTDVEKLNEIDEKSRIKPQIIFKHSTRCSISNVAKKVVTAEMNSISQEECDIYYLDLLQFRSISNTIAERYSVTHESPQIILIKNGKCVFNASHGEVSIGRALEETIKS